jgi:hypothetical protein
LADCLYGVGGVDGGEAGAGRGGDGGRAFYLIRLADRHDEDLVEAEQRKFQANAEKYPVEKARGRR